MIWRFAIIVTLFTNDKLDENRVVWWSSIWVVIRALNSSSTWINVLCAIGLHLLCKYIEYYIDWWVNNEVMSTVILKIGVVQWMLTQSGMCCKISVHYTAAPEYWSILYCYQKGFHFLWTLKHCLVCCTISSIFSKLRVQFVQVFLTKYFRIVAFIMTLECSVGKISVTPPTGSNE